MLIFVLIVLVGMSLHQLECSWWMKRGGEGRGGNLDESRTEYFIIGIADEMANENSVGHVRWNPVATRHYYNPNRPIYKGGK